MATRLVHVGVRASDLKASIRFWRDLLGLQTVAEHEHYFDLTDGYHNFRVFQHRGASRPPHVGGLLDYLHIGVRVPDLQDAFSRFVDAGVAVESDDVRVGMPVDYDNPPKESFKVSDPDGIVVDVSASKDQWPGVTL